MSFDQLPSMESQPTTMRRGDDPEYRDDPEFSRFSEDLSVKLFTLTSNISRLSQQISLLGTKRDTERVRERVHDLLDEARDGFKEAGDGIKRLTAWDDLSVCNQIGALYYFGHAANPTTGLPKIHPTKARARIPSLGHGIPVHPAPGPGEAAYFRFRLALRSRQHRRPF